MAEPQEYMAYLLRLWRVIAQGSTAWRARIENVHTGEPHGFANLDELCAFLNEQTNRKGECVMSMEELKEKIRLAGLEAWYNGNFEPWEEVYAPDVLSRHPPFPDLHGLDAVKAYVAGAREGYSDIEFEYGEMIAEGDMIAYRYSGRMKHTGTSPSLPVPPTGKELYLEGCVFVRIKEGKIVEEHEFSDYLGFLQQLGLMPPPG
jgi:predicted ester cyclase